LIPILSQVILVDENDKAIGTADKMSAHIEGLRHRAFSVFIVNRTTQGWEILLQQRAWNKYHSQGLWTNTCCSHPHPGEDIIPAAERRLQEEFGFTMPLQPVGVFHYIAHLKEKLIENEVDHVLIGYGKPDVIQPNAEEIVDYRWCDLNELKLALQKNPEQYTAWLQEALHWVENALREI
jgi:isopentenyl-diphosphate delta-isomerase